MIKKSNKYKYISGKQITDPGSGTRVYEINNYRLPSVTTVLGATKNQDFIKKWKAKVGEQEADICSTKCPEFCGKYAGLTIKDVSLNITETGTVVGIDFLEKIIDADPSTPDGFQFQQTVKRFHEEFCGMS